MRFVFMSTRRHKSIRARHGPIERNRLQDRLRKPDSFNDRIKRATWAGSACTPHSFPSSKFLRGNHQYPLLPRRHRSSLRSLISRADYNDARCVTTTTTIFIGLLPVSLFLRVRSAARKSRLKFARKCLGTGCRTFRHGENPSHRRERKSYV